jgi:hypothetical protein
MKGTHNETERSQIIRRASLETAQRIAASDTTHDVQAATYRFNARMRELETQFEIKASEIRAAFVREVGQAGSD